MDYEGWNQTLAARFFAEAEPDVPVYLAVTDAALEEMYGGLGANAAPDFEQAVRGHVSGSTPFQLELDRAIRWRRSGGHGFPPFLPALGATVLAADRMERLPGSDRGRYSYYRPLRRILRLQGDGMPDGYDEAVPKLWRLLAWWLDEHEQGKHGRPTAATSSNTNNRHIGWALSQTVLTGADRTHIGLFLTAWKDADGEQPSADSLLAGFEEWIRATRVGGKFAAALKDRHLRTILGEVLVQELKYFDGAVRDTAGRTHLALALVSEDGGLPFRLAIRVPAQFRQTALSVEGVQVPVPQGARLVELPLVGGIQTTLGKPLEVGSPSTRITLQQADCYVFQVDDVLGAWVSVTSATLGIDHLVVVRRSLVAHAQAIMASAGGPAVREIRRADIPAGWIGYAYYKPARTIKEPVVLRQLVPENIGLARLDGGLQLDPRRQTYIAGYAPDLLIPQDLMLTDPHVTCDGSVLPLPSGEGICRLPLAQVATTAGQHNVTVNGRRLTFDLMERLREGLVPVRVVRSITEGKISAGASRIDQEKTPIDAPLADKSACNWSSGAALPSTSRATGASSRQASFHPAHAPRTVNGSQLFDQILTWCSEYGSGTYEAFRIAYEWLANYLAITKSLDWRIAMNNLEILGHIELDRKRRFWGVAPAVLATNVAGGGYAFLAGQRPVWLLQRIASLTDEPDERVRRLSSSFYVKRPIRQAGGPSAIMISVANQSVADELCDILGVRSEPRAADRMLFALPGLAKLFEQKRNASSPGTDPEAMSPDDPRQWIAVTGEPEHGAYRYKRYRGFRHVYWVGGYWFETDRRSLVCAENARTGRGEFLLDIDRRQLYVPATTQLPYLHARAATLRSGLLPRLTRDPRQGDKAKSSTHVVHDNIDVAFAKTLSDLLKQKLTIIGQ